MDHRHLKAFVTLAELLHFGRAAARLNIAQPALTQQIKRLEQRLGMPLFIRDRRHVALTPQGALLLPEAQAVVRQQQRFSTAAVSIRRGERGVLHIGYVGSAILDPALTGLFTRYRQRFPQIDTQVEEHPVETQLALLEAGLLDVGMVRAPFPCADGLHMRALQARPLRLVLPCAHPLAQQREVALSAFAGERFVLLQDPPGVGLGHSALSACLRAGFTPANIHLARDVSMAVGLVASGMGVTLVPDTQRVMALASVAYLPLTDEQATTTLYAVWRRRSPALNAFLRCMSGENAEHSS